MSHMTTADDAKRKAARTYNLASDHDDHPTNSFWERYGRSTVERVDLFPAVVSRKAMRRIDVPAIMLLIALATYGQQTAPAPETNPCPRPEYELFARIVGRWNVHWRDRIAPGKYAETDATSEVTRDPIGCVIAERFSGTRGGRPYRFLAFISFANDKRLQQLWLDSAHGEFLEFTGTGITDGARFDWERDLGNRRLLLKREYHIGDNDAFVTETYLSPDGGATWDQVSRAQYRRVK
jgi:hypothetical protein